MGQYEPPPWWERELFGLVFAGIFAAGLAAAALALLVGCATVPDQVAGVPVPRIDDTLDAALMTPEQRCAEGKRLLATIPDPTRDEKLLAIASCAK